MGSTNDGNSKDIACHKPNLASSENSAIHSRSKESQTTNGSSSGQNDDFHKAGTGRESIRGARKKRNFRGKWSAEVSPAFGGKRLMRMTHGQLCGS
jgi:hypothetical protein